MNVMIILNYNDYGTVIDYISRIKEYSSIDQIVIVDNCSTDNSVHELKKYECDKVHLILAQANRGYAVGNNVGIRYALSTFNNIESIIISNPDIYISDSDINKILSALKNGYHLSTGVIYNYSNKTSTLASNFGWQVPSYKDMLINSLLFLYKFRRAVLKKSNYLSKDAIDNNTSKYLPVGVVPGCFFATKPDAIKSVDYFDEGTFLFCEENILGKKYMDKGYTSCIVTGTVINHENSATINKNIKKEKDKAKLRMNSECFYIRKYLKKSELSIFIFRIVFWFGWFERQSIYWLKRKHM